MPSRLFLAPALLAIPLFGACAGHQQSATPPAPLDIAAPPTLPWAGTTLVLRAEQAHRLSPVRWSVSDAHRAWISPDGTLTFLEAGDVAVQASDGWRTGSRAFSVRANPAAKIVMQQRVVARAAVGDTVRVLGHVWDAEGARIPDAPVSYALVARGDVPPAATVSADGRFVAREPGIYTVVAECGRASGRTIVIVEGVLERAARELVALRAMRAPQVAPAQVTPNPAPGGPPQDQVDTVSGEERHRSRATSADSTHALGAVRIAATRTTRVTISDFDAAPYEGTTLALAARVWMDDNRADTTAQVLWQSSDPDRAYVTQSGQVIFLAPGWVTITATHGAATAVRRFNVRWLPATRLALRPSAVDVVVGQAVRFREDVWLPGSIPVVDARVNYAIIAHGVEGAVPATVTEDRVFTARQSGVYTVIAEVGGVADKFTMLVRDRPTAAR